MQEVIDRRHIVARIEDWNNRIESLYEVIRNYYRGLPPIDAQDLLDGKIFQVEGRDLE
jgi:hypothetical protein